MTAVVCQLSRLKRIPPAFITLVFRDMPGVWKSQHRLMLCWVVVMQALYPGRKTLAELSRWSPAAVTSWRLRRLLKASYWSIHVLVAWLANDVIATLPRPKTVFCLTLATAVTSPNAVPKHPRPKEVARASIIPGFSGRSSWIPGSWHLRMVYTDAILFHDPSQESSRAGQHQESHR
jgi:hypothetical protein